MSLISSPDLSHHLHIHEPLESVCKLQTFCLKILPGASPRLRCGIRTWHAPYTDCFPEIILIRVLARKGTGPITTLLLKISKPLRVTLCTSLDELVLLLLLQCLSHLAFFWTNGSKLSQPSRYAQRLSRTPRIEVYLSEMISPAAVLSYKPPLARLMPGGPLTTIISLLEVAAYV